MLKSQWKCNTEWFSFVSVSADVFAVFFIFSYEYFDYLCVACYTAVLVVCECQWRHVECVMLSHNCCVHRNALREHPSHNSSRFYCYSSNFECFSQLFSPTTEFCIKLFYNIPLLESPSRMAQTSTEWTRLLINFFPQQTHTKCSSRFHAHCISTIKDYRYGVHVTFRKKMKRII